MKKASVVFGIMVGLCILQSSVFALPISFYGGASTGSTEGLGSFEGTLVYSSVSSELTIELTNTSDVGNGGYLTAFAFNNPGDAITGASLTSSMADFDLIGGAGFDNSIDASPFADFDIGASSTNGKWLGGGSPNDGIAVGDTATFTFTLEGDLAGLTEQSFLDELNGPNGQFFAARFRGFENGGSDKVPGIPTTPPTPPSAVPEPSTVLLVGVGLLGLFGLGRKRIKK